MPDTTVLQPQVATVKLNAKPLSLPAVVIQILKITSENRDDVLDQLDRAIGTDPGFAGRMLATANSPAFGIKSEVSTIKQALCILGTKGIRNLALAVSVSDVFQCSHKDDLLRTRVWWRLSCDSAVFARWLARERRLTYGDEAYLAALLHLVGKMLIVHSAPNTYQMVEKLVNEGFPVLTAERAVYGTDNAELTTKALTDWGLPSGMVSRLSIDEAPEPNDPYLGVRALTCFARALLNPDGNVGQSGIPDWTLEVLRIERDEINDIIERGRQALDATGRAA